MCEQTRILKRRACRLLDQSRSSQNYRKAAVSDHGKLRDNMRSILLENPRYGYQRLHRQFRQKDFAVNHKLVYRLYRQMDLPLRRKARRRKGGQRCPLAAARECNRNWSVDFIHDRVSGVTCLSHQTISHSQLDCPGRQSADPTKYGAQTPAN